ncbi:MAG: hypothetical protein BWX61_00182 [Bacteroidetes bacterium ADurb.Bin035]|nr:DUF349 domain-containing protein [Bacteroidales bacterium]OQC48335.1 MAG: hypothetical protein BWX61_00182 [Bacteroidetes bacterium ADurb.Bin035]HNY75439.1 DUF349 domain-containing protein [Bacteroidales bacterium]HOH93285.1 DUF349 domain-containing protein [Bacteroidales bacterium]HPM39657.1 DUF349 domain-containing protein [Bacteroidales bacterium]
MDNEEMKDQLSMNNDADVNNPQAEIENTDNKELKYQIEEVSEEEEEDFEVDEAEKQRYDKLNLDQINEEFAKVLENNDLSYIRPRVLRLYDLHQDIYENELKTISAISDDEQKQKAEELLHYKKDAFDKLWKQYLDRKKLLKDQYLQSLEDNYQKKLAILEQLKNIIDNNEIPLKEAFDHFNKIQEEWKAIGAVPHNKANDLWMRFNHYVDQFYKKVELLKEMIEIDQRKNLEAKIELCEKAESLLMDKSISTKEAYRQVYELFDQWKQIGPVPKDKKDEIWERFQAALDKIKENYRGSIESQKQRRESNLEAKKAIIDKMKQILSEEITTHDLWQKKTAEVQDLFNVWRSIGPVPQEFNETIWKEFKSLVDKFYQDKKEYYEILKTEWQENYNKKLSIVKQAENLVNSNNWKQDTQTIQKLQEEWKKIGFIPSEKNEYLWRRFRAACDQFFANKEMYFANLSTQEIENLSKKEAILKELDEFQFNNNPKEDIERLKNIQRQWYEIGNVPYKDRQRIQDAFRQKINQLFDQLKGGRTDESDEDFKQRLENILNNNSNSGIKEAKSELYNINNQIKKLQSDIQTWENNLSFFKASANAELLLQEYIKKIDNAKADLKFLEEKAKYLRQALDSSEKK